MNLYILTILLIFYKCAIASENTDLIQQIDEKGNLVENSEQKNGEEMLVERTLDGALIVSFKISKEKSNENLKYKNNDKKQNSSNKKMRKSCCSCI